MVVVTRCSIVFAGRVANNAWTRLQSLLRTRGTRFGDLPEVGDLGDFEFQTTDGASCSVAADAYAGDTVITDGR